MGIVSFARFGYSGEIVKVEADLRRGIPAVDIVGLPDGAVKEARERMRAAIRNSGLEYPKERILLNLSPADLKKEGSSFDLPIALAVLGANREQDLYKEDTPIMALGELELSGKIRPVKGVLAAVSRGLEEGITSYIVPKENLTELLQCKGASVFGVDSLIEAVLAYQKSIDSKSVVCRGLDEQEYTAVWSPDTRCMGDFADIKGQAVLVRALQIAAAGGHNLIAYGPPGCGKTLALSKFISLLPDLDQKTASTVTRIHSLAGFPELACCIQDKDEQHFVRPPFREPHQGASLEGMTGGGKNGSPGEISLAHGGALFLDEAAQFKTSVLQALRTPIETGSIQVSRAGKSSSFPARFQLIMAVNPCPCGHFGSIGCFCSCSSEQVARYWKRLAAPLLDRIELRIRVSPSSGEELTKASGFSTAELQKDIACAREAQWLRNRAWAHTNMAGEPEWLNAHIVGPLLENICNMEETTKILFIKIIEKAHFSSRGAHAILSIARTIADLAGEAQVREEHLFEASSLRTWSETVPDFLGN